MLLSIFLQSYGRYDYHEPSWLDALDFDIFNLAYLAIGVYAVFALLQKFWRWISEPFREPPEIEPLEAVHIGLDEQIERLRMEREKKKMNEEFRRFMKDKKRSVEEKDAFRIEWVKRYNKLNGLD